MSTPPIPPLPAPYLSGWPVYVDRAPAGGWLVTCACCGARRGGELLSQALRRLGPVQRHCRAQAAWDAANHAA